MSVSTEVLGYVLPVHGRLGVDVPSGFADPIDEAIESLWIAKVAEGTKLSCVMQDAERITHFGSEDSTQGFDGKEKSSMRSHPRCGVVAKSSASYDGVDMGVIFEFSGPSMQNERHPKLG
jgi:hypothetical protein